MGSMMLVKISLLLVLALTVFLCKTGEMRQFGVRDLTDCGTSVLTFLPNKSSDGLRLHLGKGVTLQLSRVLRGSSVSEMSFLMV